MTEAQSKLLEGLRQATKRVEAWPAWKRIMFERSHTAEQYAERMRKGETE